MKKIYKLAKFKQNVCLSCTYKLSYVWTNQGFYFDLEYFNNFIIIQAIAF